MFLEILTLLLGEKDNKELEQERQLNDEAEGEDAYYDNIANYDDDYGYDDYVEDYRCYDPHEDDDIDDE